MAGMRAHEGPNMAVLLRMNGFPPMLSKPCSLRALLMADSLVTILTCFIFWDSVLVIVF